jgi:hypothetical protein
MLHFSNLFLSTFIKSQVYVIVHALINSKLHAGRSRVRDQMREFNFINLHNLSGSTRHWVYSVSKMHTRDRNKNIAAE